MVTAKHAHRLTSVAQKCSKHRNSAQHWHPRAWACFRSRDEIVLRAPPLLNPQKTPHVELARSVVAFYVDFKNGRHGKPSIKQAYARRIYNPTCAGSADPTRRLVVRSRPGAFPGSDHRHDDAPGSAWCRAVSGTGAH